LKIIDIALVRSFAIHKEESKIHESCQDS
jgi:hypothetical protein